MTEAMQPTTAGSRRPSNVLSRILSLVLSVGVAVVIGALGTGGTYAYLNASTSSGAGVMVTAGSARLTATAPTAMTNFSPGLVQRSPFTVSNTGDVALSVSASSVASSNAAAALVGGVAAGDCSGLPAAGAPLGTALATVQPGQSATLCFVAQMPASAALGAAGQSTQFTITLSGVQQ
ncbi:hypothetical protein FVA74_08275 [Salinibacterium sp. dk2585]|uniref:hypothetical protein n=1 Tax=unclassified Salinibacterium TaxID=2632331 RepID=UPI0011C244AB|nr:MULTISPECIES: hypothetical protein [unclassified Salinibacterium]QEE61574.1 hypothetical protein FVA74_08275 [Salinibacterium sp. dk2585]TXK52457.1 hypothetical protein FVP63_12815 [Salinibacterium sp. dk5596]